MKRLVSIGLILTLCFSCYGVNASAFQEGETRIQTNNWGIEVYLSKTAINVASAGIEIGSLFIPHAVINKVVCGLGIALGQCPGGVVLEYNYSWMAIKSVIPVVNATLSWPTKVRWQ